MEVDRLGLMLTLPFFFLKEKREEIEKGEEMNVREHAVYAQCRCEAENCIGRLFS